MYNPNCCRRKRQVLKPFTHALALGFYFRVPTEGSSKRLFALSLRNSESMRYVGGGFLNNPVTRANQSREGGLGIEPGGSDKSLAVMRLESFKSVRCEAMTWLRKAVIEAERNFILMR